MHLGDGYEYRIRAMQARDGEILGLPIKHQNEGMYVADVNPWACRLPLPMALVETGTIHPRISVC
ncbi:hypothetical protein AG1IA_08761 [Rhizoctonia solani AG-1 IA]|uniref:Uncharacterized protein n=1 Tax=Thanatephorus cucumeris (strain AG1-IA) TaxID=983506 RepID=L8WK64_THACA|nr:hypothetical protein AG1IA_08761 [Rhizoctonia solani AG-1 IA]